MVIQFSKAVNRLYVVYWLGSFREVLARYNDWNASKIYKAMYAWPVAGSWSSYCPFPLRDVDITLVSYVYLVTVEELKDVLKDPAFELV